MGSPSLALLRPSEYTKVLDARGEQPRLLNRMFQLMEMGPEGEAHIEVLCRYFSDARVAMERHCVLTQYLHCIETV
ncbi:immediate early protein ICP-46 [Frog virus 3]|uniref:Immediate early protein ICP-46 n=1 Tax=Frog virus 3 TaxID=10493 RepID=A0A5B8P4H6_FRG3V|nr:immediate early protein ICP-46 [Frog virus 3]